MHAADHTFGGGGIELFRKNRIDAKLAKAVAMEGLHKAAARIGKERQAHKEGTGEGSEYFSHTGVALQFKVASSSSSEEAIRTN